MALAYSFVAFIVAIFTLTLVHEAGHFCVARCLGVRVLRFSIGFGPVLFSWQGRTGTHYAVAAIPLGGYIKMLDDSGLPRVDSDGSDAFETKPLWARAAVIVAGPAANFLLAIGLLWMALAGFAQTQVIPVVGQVVPHSEASTAGLQSGDEIVRIAGQATPDWRAVLLRLTEHVGDKTVVPLQVKAAQSVAMRALTLNMAIGDWSRRGILDAIGIVLQDAQKVRIASVKPDTAAAQAGLRSGDELRSIAGRRDVSVALLLQTVTTHANRSVRLEIQRNGQPRVVKVTPQADINGKGVLGITLTAAWAPQQLRNVQYANWPALRQATSETLRIAMLTLKIFSRIVTGQASWHHLNGPVSIAENAGYSARVGIQAYLNFLALVSISLGVINMLPIPPLDGGHLLYLLLEAVRGKAVSLRWQNLGFAMGFGVLSVLILAAFYNDLNRFLQ